DGHVTGVQTCALPILKAEIEDHLSSCSACADTHARLRELQMDIRRDLQGRVQSALVSWRWAATAASILFACSLTSNVILFRWIEIGRASCRERVEVLV